MMQTLLAETSIGVTELKKNPSQIIREAGAETVVVLHHNKPSAYLVPAKTYEALMDVIDDLSLLPVVQQRIADWQLNPNDVVAMSREELQHIADGATAPKINAKIVSTKASVKANPSKPATKKTQKQKMRQTISRKK